MAYIHKVYDDGSISMGYESGDEVALSENIIHYDLNGREYGRTLAGTVIKIKRPLKISNKPYQTYFAESDESVIFRVQNYQLNEKSVVDPRPSPPILYVIPWHEGRLTKFARVLAFSPRDAVNKLHERIYKWRGTDDGWDIYDPVPNYNYEETGDEVWVVFLGI